MHNSARGETQPKTSRVESGSIVMNSGFHLHLAAKLSSVWGPLLRDISFNWAFTPRRSFLDRRERRFLRAFSARRHHEAEREIKLHIGNVLLSDDIPDPRDVALIGLVDACDLLGDIFPERNIDRLRPRIEQLRKMDLIGRELAGAISDIEHNVKMALSGARS